MTRNRQTAARTATLSGQWALQDAKARFSEVVRKARTEGPQRITVHGREEVVVVSVEEDPRVRGLRIEHEGTRAPVRRLKL
jgi:prevent-host-death family protein